MTNAGFLPTMRATTRTTALTLLLVTFFAVSACFGSTDEDTIIAYDTGNRLTWWCSDRDSFGAGVRFTPSEYPCEVIGARAEINYDDGQEIYLRVWDDDSTGGLPGTILYNEQRLDIPPIRTPGFRDYDLTETIRIDSGDFYIVFWQKDVWDMQFSSDENLDSVSRQWWWFPDQGWVTPYGGNPGDHLIRARVRYGSGICEELGPIRVPGTAPTVISSAHLLAEMRQDPDLVLFDATGREILDPKSLSPGIFFLRTTTTSRKVIITE